MHDFPMWPSLVVFSAILIFVDLFFLGGGKKHKISPQEARRWSWTWVILALFFGTGVAWFQGFHPAIQFFASYLLEKSLSIENIIIFILIFNYFAVPPDLQRRVLLWGVVGAIIFRGLMLVLGTEAIEEFKWLLYAFGAVLLLTGVSLFFTPDSDRDLARHPLLNWMRRHFKLTHEFHGVRFFIRKQKALFFTPLLVAFIFVALADLVFAINSVPAVFSVTQDPFIIFTSNVFAILGLRALFVSLQSWLGRFHLLKYGFGLVLLFVGAKMLRFFHLPVLISLGLIVLILGITALLSFIVKPHHLSAFRRFRKK